MKILVTGGAGYIGSHVVYELIDQGHDVTILDDMSLGLEENIDPRSIFVQGSTHSDSDLDSVLSVGFDGIIHLAAWKAAGESMTDPAKYAHNNLIGTINLLNACDRHGIKRFVFSSTSSVYGNPEYIPIDENHPTDPISYYGETKLQVEKNLKWFSELKGIRFGVLRYFNAAGYDIKGRIKGRERNALNLIPIAMEVAAGIREKMQVFGDNYDTHDGTGVRDYIHVSDLAIAHRKALNYISENDKDLLVNLATGDGHSVLDVINKAKEVSRKDIPFDIVGRRAGDPATVVAVSNRANKVLDWSTKYSDLDTLIRTSWDVYK
ncbi:MAG: UDP-glucose 4-epimerase GalE [Candidatus Marinimicrobia bacterium]|jgi:UDP-glucose 4-epimerase|nr:UDP-glucose 4-epimerase GalE [Candidatus Neomarinimicrobiota bacterium]MBT3848816.1 UDP-glucose 4-epimerase GalE [Candidatus Neomarinimicrobiota bacterium]MBT4054605.1 UDP-glucose 4-epimerase GalE [Candidatus Neomarinimicrobiota bacterium]MBT4369770.1 UDP-glucose 4-epimerase GalE [Candidatus Neomarinimicrobiota bacterium]MBT4663197.1 UDP-glucose 4-epimerase GalE [Candidatus Neomarinimicrobiota bacterium]